MSTGGLGAEVVEGLVHGHPCRMYEVRPSTVTELTHEGRRWADRVFIVHGERRVTYARHELAVGLAGRLLQRHGVGTGDRVAIFASNSAEWSVAFFAALRIGAVAVPCNGWWSADEVAHACREVSPTVIVTDERSRDRVPEGVPQLALEEVTACLDAEPGQGDPVADLVTSEDQLGVILFTSGTTGAPRGVALSHRALIANVQNFLVVSRKLPHQVPDDNPPSVTLASLPLFHIGAIQLLMVPFVHGSRIVFSHGRFDPVEVLRLVEDEGITMWSAVPTMVRRVLDHEALATASTTSLRTIVLGGAPVAQDLLRRIAESIPTAKRGTGQAYGLSEAGGVVSTAVAAGLKDHPGSSGRLMPVAEVRIADPDANGTGEILVRSPAVMEGYWGVEGGDGDETVTEDRWLHTGDLGYVDEDGYLYVRGRLKDLIIRGGENIAPGHIESRLLAHPCVAEAAVIGVPNADLGEEVAAVLVLAGQVTPAELAEFCRETLGGFEVPSRWWIRTEPLPKNDSGKILKRDLLDEWGKRS
ncbi:MAG TPA: class I adenylate-forming enzyme family protein [Pseudonocardia sp.]|nr:class I adenylate-forming enzyme family protein [Pseudonocardia sp.]